MYATRRTTTQAGTVTLSENEGGWWVGIQSDHIAGTRQFEDIETASGYFKRKVSELQIVEILLEHSSSDASEFDRFVGIDETVLRSINFEDVASAITNKMLK